MPPEKAAREIILYPHCKNRFSVPAPKVEKPINYAHTSVLVVSHERPIQCPNCKHYMVLGITDAALKFQAGPIPDEVAKAILDDEESRVVIANAITGANPNGKR